LEISKPWTLAWATPAATRSERTAVFIASLNVDFSPMSLQGENCNLEVDGKNKRLYLWSMALMPGDEASSMAFFRSCVARIASYPKINRSEPIIVLLRVRVGMEKRIRDYGMPVGVLADDDQSTCGGGARRIAGNFKGHNHHT
jgi:hypothetical protein